MAPDAPSPIYDSLGNVVVSWQIVLTYDGITDEIVMTWRHEEGPYHAAREGQVVTPGWDPVQARDAFLMRLGILSARRLF